ncbi:HAMP domain-containing histidine kinase [Nostoc sphaeroides CHAB 2801]|uniref:sensor histidine kinase n=1 Tax=Nostoc sphaeroides TaxID=446679 RepID=UPI001E522768|nr:HAMP domain-containing sensor histidine kinase [Nostoc sphaeroides]MCC5633138.1 HAMP domain-containing histidine kinase [Nostoc sphaeroides CHAB 2801]
MNLEIEPVDLASVIRSAADTIRLSAETKGIQIQLHLDAAVSNVLGDAIRLQQVVWNLLSNAIKFSSKNQSVEVRLEEVESQAQITVIDRGRGIEAEFLPFVFERFSQCHASTSRSAGGLGLGLAIALTIVELHNGNITAASAGFGKGSTFTVRLPIVTMTTVFVTKTVPAGSATVPSVAVRGLVNSIAKRYRSDYSLADPKSSA